MAEGDQQQEPLGWRSALPDDLKTHESLVPYKNVGEFAKAHIETATKLKDVEGKLGNSIPKLTESATPEEREKYFNSLGRPEKAELYELEGGDVEKEKLLESWKKDFHELGFTAAQAKGLKAKWDARLNSMVDAHKAEIDRVNAQAESELKAEWGDKYPANMELAKRLWKGELSEKDAQEADKHFDSLPASLRKPFLKFLFKMAAKTGEDTSMRGSGQRQTAPKPGYDMSKFNLPPARV